MSRKTWWHKKIRSASTPVAQLGQAYDYLRAVAASHPPHVIRRVVPPLTESVRQSADDLLAALKEEGK